MIAKPRWLRRDIVSSPKIEETRKFLRDSSVNTVCESAKCPNLCECFGRGVATFIILGDTCTRGCRFCAVNEGIPSAPDREEPSKVYEAARKLNLNYIVVTSVTRDDLPDGGAAHYAATVGYLRERLSGVKIEVLVPDFMGRAEHIDKVCGAGIDVFAHNLDTVRRLHKAVKPKSDYNLSLTVLGKARDISRGGIPTKSGLMLGLGETEEEVVSTMKDLRWAGCDIITLGQYLKPSLGKTEEREFISPKMFEKYEEIAYNLGFTRVSSGPFVRSSYHSTC
ncbi:MAG: lipoyl synthase [Candidatus Omnitrophota bacterium]|jgi:lipoic acid synthetase